jgi:2-oxoglutarate ferredoxin oxidoreductase subunit gamma
VVICDGNPRRPALELELLLSGIGGQGIQLVGKVLALAAVSEGRQAMVYGEFGGEMRGGKSIVNVVIGAERLRGLPIVSNASHVIAMHQKFWEEVVPRVAPDAMILTDSTIQGQLEAPGRRFEHLPGLELANQAGSAQAAGLVVLGGFAAMTGVVRIESLIEAMKQLVPAYRRQHVETNEKALRLGAAAATPGASPINLDQPEAAHA